MPGRGSYGPSGKWIHDRAEHILSRNEDLRNKGSRGKSIAYALATQQAHRNNKSPKNFRTNEGVEAAKAKYQRPREEYTQTAAPKREKRSASEIVEAWLRKQGGLPAIPVPRFSNIARLQSKGVTSMPKGVAHGVKPPASRLPGQVPRTNTAPYQAQRAAQPPPAQK